MKLFIPAIGYRIELSAEWSFKLYPERRNETLYVALSGKDMPILYRSSDNKLWKESTIDAKLSAGTILEVDRVYIRADSKAAQSNDDDFDSLTFKVIKSSLSSKRKGRMLRFWAKLEDVNKIEYRLPIDFTVGKDTARENVKKPKKLSPLRVQQLVKHAFAAFDDSLHCNAPAWLTTSVVEQLCLAVEEYKRLYVPWQQIRNTSLMKDFAAMHVQYAPLQTDHDSKWSYIVSNVIMNNSCVFSRMHDGRRCRTFRRLTPRYCHDYDIPSEPDVSHVWIKVYSSVDDLDIVGMEAGIDATKA